MNWDKNTNIRDAGHWLSKKIELIELKDKQKTLKTNINILRGGIFNVELGEGNIGAEKNKKRPCLVLSHNNLNKGDIVVIIPLSTKFNFDIKNGQKIPKYANHYVFYKAKYDFLTDDSCVKCEDVRSIDKVRIVEHLGNIDPKDLDKIKNRILFTFGF